MNAALITRLLTTGNSFAPLALRIPAGIIFMAHGALSLDRLLGQRRA